MLFTAVLRVSLVRSQGLSTLMQVQQKLARGEAPGQEIVEGMMLAMAGILLVIPGFVNRCHWPVIADAIHPSSHCCLAV